MQEDRLSIYEIRLISAVMANVWTDGGDPLKVNLTVAREMVRELINELLLERGFEQSLKIRRKN